MDAFNPASINPPFGHYSHGVDIGPGARWLHLSGQVGVNPAGDLLDGLAAQTEQAFANIDAILTEAGYTRADLVKVTTFLVARAGEVNTDDVAAYRDVRNQYLGPNKPTSTLLVVAGLADPKWLIEIEAIAAKVE